MRIEYLYRFPVKGLSAEAIVDTRGRSDQGPSDTITLGALKAEDAQP